MKKLEIIQTLKFNEMETEDGGQFHYFVIVDNDDDENGIYVKFCSWDDNMKHEDLAKFINKKVKFTVEVLD